MIIRLRMWAIVLLIATDQLLHCLLAGPKYLIIGGPRPDPDETVSGKVGRMAIKGKRWARACEWLIDGVFRLLGSGDGHCRAASAREQGRK
jgi:hypothetical protein